VDAKKEHFVPQFYLRRFANDDRLNVYDKALGRSFGAHMRDVASFAVDEPRQRQRVDPGAHAGDPPHVAGSFIDPGGDALEHAHSAHSDTARDDEGVELDRGRQYVVRPEAHAIARRERRAVHADDDDLVRQSAAVRVWAASSASEPNTSAGPTKSSA
jgi:uncharacterized protein DUF4238